MFNCKLDSLVYMGQRQMHELESFEVVVVPVDRKHVLCNDLLGGSGFYYAYSRA